VRNPAGLRRFPSPHPSFFSGFLVEFLGSNVEGMGVAGLYRGEGLSPEVRGRQAPEPRATAIGGPVCKFFFTKQAYRPLPGRQGPVALPMGYRGTFLKFF